MIMPKGVDSSPSVAEMYAAAAQLVDGQHLDDMRNFDLTDVVLATNSPGDIKQAQVDSAVSQMMQAYAVSRDPTLDAPDSVSFERGRMLAERQHELSRPARRRMLVATGLASLAVSALAVLHIGAAKYDLSRANDPGVMAFVGGNQMFSNNTLEYDPSILPGDMGEGVPVIGVIRHLIPGVPDYGPVAMTHSTYKIETTTREHVTLEAGYGGANTQHPVAPDLVLTGPEYRLARQTASDMLRGIDPDTVTIDAVRVEGLASDELHGVIGEDNPEQIALARARANVGAQAFMDEARERSIAVAAEPVTDGHEVVLNPAQAEQLYGAARQQGLTVDELLSAYNRGDTFPGAVQTALDTHIGKNRGATFSVETTQQIPSSLQESTATNILQELHSVEDFPGEPVALFIGLPFLAGGVAAAYVRRFGRSAHRRARRIVRKAGLEL